MRLAGKALGRVASFASKPAPTLDRRCSQVLCSKEISCGSGLAREGARPDTQSSSNARIHDLR
ncbi:hypothetical protein EAH78_13305 [Pseudomonas arsenicoxydans]|uniref:Uncharacterized protein n=1 Tax=Pseudomonas arsenicoxydans TaxID=702115 RepID=A0A502HYT2_9PSED|nr:hypothetical protein EAH78_13305 [Pseudomonas arsenicoxydans]